MGVTHHGSENQAFGQAGMLPEMIEQYFPHLTKIELNRRGLARPGWSVWGNEAEAEITETASESLITVDEPAPAFPPSDTPAAAGLRIPDDGDLDLPNFLRHGHPDCTWGGPRA
jgi:hypothetical protein